MKNMVFRFRYGLHFAIYVLAFWAPWNSAVALDPKGPNAHVWGILAANLAQLGIGSLAAPVFNPFNLLLAAAILCALTGAWLRTWGSAYLGSSVVQSADLHTAGDGILTEGPFGYVRNPLYLGTLLHTLALALLMPRSGAIFAIAAIGGLQLWLIRAEEGFLSGRLGAPYKAYCARVPRVFPALRRRVAAAGATPRWGQAFAGEVYFWGVALSLMGFGWRYDASLLIRCVIVSLGVSIMVRAVTGKGSTG